MPKLKINNIDIEVEAGTSILQAAEMLGIEIPRFCYHDRLSVPANCRMCLVEIEGGPPKPVASCAMACGDGMVIKTESEMVKKARSGVMEMLLINHPLDCPICDQGGECDLQDQAMGYGFDRSRFHENKRAVPDKELGPLIKTIMTRCINCTRCVRFADEVAGAPVIGQLNRGEDAEIGTFIDELVKTELSGNMIDICPVGALTSKPYAFKARPWELTKTESIDVHDALGCNIRIDVRGREVMRVLPRLHEDINEEWINDRTRFAYDGLKYGRLDRPYIKDKKTGKYEECSWEDAFLHIAQKLKRIKPSEMAALVGDLCELEAIVALKDLMEEMGVPHKDCRTDGAQFDPSQRAGYLFNSGIAGIDEADAILLVGTNPRWEGTLVNTRIHRAAVERRVPVSLIGEAADLTYPYVHAGEKIEDLLELIKEQKKSLKAKKPMMIVGSGVFQRPDGLAVHQALYQAAEDLGLIKENWNGFNILHTSASRVGALDVGFVPQKEAKGFAEILEGTKDKSIKVLFLLGADEFNAAKEIDKDTFVIYQGHHGDHGAMRADVILPAASYAEKDGLYVNTEGRPQLALRAATPPGDAREDWTILRALSEHIAKPLPYNTRSELLARIYKEWPHLEQIDVRTPAPWKKFGKKGKLNKARLASPIKDFYLTNAICRASKTMQACSKEFLRKDPKLMLAAE